MVPSQFLSVVLNEENESGNEEQYSSHPSWHNYEPPKSDSTISDQEMWNLTKNLPKALLAECTVEVSRTPVNQNETVRKRPCFDARVSPVFSYNAPKSNNATRTLPHYLPPPPQLLHRSEWLEERMDVHDLLTGVEAVYSDNESDGNCEEAASVSIFPITVAKVEKTKQEKVKKQDINKFSYPCEHCPNVYSNRGALWQHSVATHSVEKTCECKICGRKFYRNCSLALHLKSHSEEEYCQCKECGKSFNRLANLERHMKIHTDAEVFPCPNCDKVFRDMDNLLRHAVVHTSAKTIHCDICNKSFKTQDHLDFHNKTVHTKSGRPDMSFLPPYLIDSHNNNATLLQQDSLAKVNYCKVCNVYFPDKNALKKHKLHHPGVVKVACTLCGIDFTQKSSLLRHVKRMHPQESDGLIDPLQFDDKSSGTDNYEGSSDNSSLHDMESDDFTEMDEASNAEIRKVLGSPIKSKIGGVIDKHNTVEIQKVMVSNSDMSNKSSISNCVPKEEAINSNVCSGSNELSQHYINAGNSEISVLRIGEEMSAKETVESKVEVKLIETKHQGKIDIADPLSSVDINTMHTVSPKLEKPDLTASVD